MMGAQFFTDNEITQPRNPFTSRMGRDNDCFCYCCSLSSILLLAIPDQILHRNLQASACTSSAPHLDQGYVIIITQY
jgi:hypothetical protein